MIISQRNTSFYAQWHSIFSHLKREYFGKQHNKRELAWFCLEGKQQKRARHRLVKTNGQNFVKVRRKKLWEAAGVIKKTDEKQKSSVVWYGKEEEE